MSKTLLNPQTLKLPNPSAIKPPLISQTLKKSSMLNNETHCSKTNYIFNCTIVPGYMHVNNKKNCPKN